MLDSGLAGARTRIGKAAEVLHLHHGPITFFWHQLLTGQHLAYSLFRGGPVKKTLCNIAFSITIIRRKALNFFIFATHPFTFNRICKQKFDLLTSFAPLVWQVMKICGIGITNSQPRWEQPAQEFSTQCLLAISPCYGVIQQVSAAIKKNEMRSSSARPGRRGGAPGRLRSVFPRLRGATRRAWLPPHRWGHPQVWQTIGYLYLCFLFIDFITIFW